MLRLVAIPLLLSCVGCSIAPISLDQPPASDPVETPNGKAEIVVMRSGSLFGAAISFGVYINDLHVGTLGISDFVSHAVEPGTVEMFAGAESRSEARFPVEANRRYYFQVFPKMGWWFARVQMQLMEPADGRAAMADYDDATLPEPKPYPFDLKTIKAPTP